MATSLIVDAPVQLIKAGDAEERVLLGVCLLAHLKSLLCGCVFWHEIVRKFNRLTLQTLGAIYTDHHESTLVGKAFEIAIAELFQRRNGSCHRAIVEGLEIAVQKRKGAQVKVVCLGDPSELACVRIAWPGLDCKLLTDAELDRFRLITKANCGIGHALNAFPGLAKKVDAVFCDRDSEEPHKRFAVLASLKTNPDDFQPAQFKADYREIPIDVGITLTKHTRFQDVAMWREDLGIPVVYLTLEIDPQLGAWKAASKLIIAALKKQEKKAFLKWIKDWLWALKGKNPFDEWVDFLAQNLSTELNELVAKVEEKISGKFSQRSIVVPKIGQYSADYSIDALPFAYANVS